jgi:hypothetical protein
MAARFIFLASSVDGAPSSQKAMLIAIAAPSGQTAVGRIVKRVRKSRLYMKMKLISTTISALATVLVPIIPAQAADSSASGVDFRYSPPEWQTAICLPDDPQKSLVDRSGELLYHYGQGTREFATRVGVEVAPGAAWREQDLFSPRVPIVQTHFALGGLEILEETFAVADLPQANAPAPALRPLDTASPVGPPRNDLMLVHLTNSSGAALTLRPRLIVDTILPFAFHPETQQALVNDHEIISASLRMTGMAEEHQSRRAIQLEALTVPAGQSATFFVLYSGGGSILIQPATLEQALACRQSAISYWETAPLPYGRVQVPDAGIQALVDSSIRNIWQAREIKKGAAVFQVGPTCYRGLWIVDGAFLLEAAAMLGEGKDARNGVAYELTYQQPDGRIQVLPNYSKENGIVLWTCLRHAQLTQDKAWLESIWPKLERIAGYIKSLRQQTLTNASPLDDGLVPAGFPDGGIGGVIDEYTNPYWNLAGLRAFIQGARWLGKDETAAAWQSEYDDFMAAFRRAAKRDMKTDPHGNAYLPIRMDGQDLPQRAQWAFCHAVYPGQIFATNDPLVAGTLVMLQATEREGMVYGTGWDATGIWNYFASFYAHAWLWEGNGPKAAQVLTAFANHAAPTLVWREEQSLLGHKFTKVGDMPHNWASAEFIRLTIHLLELDRGDELHLLEGLPRDWLGPGKETQLNGVATPFGPLYMTMRADDLGNSVSLSVKPVAANCKAIVMHLPDGRTMRLSPQKGGAITFPVGKSLEGRPVEPSSRP